MSDNIKRNDFLSLIARGYDVQRIWDAHYSTKYPELLCLDFKYIVAYTTSKTTHKSEKNKQKEEKRKRERIYDYTRVIMYMPDEKRNRKEIQSMTIRKPDDCDYDKFFNSVGLSLEAIEDKMSKEENSEEVKEKEQDTNPTMDLESSKIERSEEIETPQVEEIEVETMDTEEQIKQEESIDPKQTEIEEPQSEELPWN